MVQTIFSVQRIEPTELEDVFKVQKKQDVVQVFGSLGGLQLRLIHPKSKELFQATDPLILAIF